MRFPRLLLLILALATLPSLAAAQTRFPGSVTRPGSRGDQLLFFYDTRDGFTTFMNLRSTGASALPIQILFYGPDMGAPFVYADTLPVGPGSAGDAGVGGTLSIDLGGLRAIGLPAQAGLAIVTAVDQSGAPIVTRVLTGSFTVANLQTGSAWGSIAAARTAVKVESTDPNRPCTTRIESPDRGSVIDGKSILLPPVQPTAADLAVYYNPDSLAPATLGGNQLIFVTFEDVVGVPYAATPGVTTWTAEAVRDNGRPLKEIAFDTTGVSITDLVSLLGPDARGARGSVIFNAEQDPKRLTRLIFFTQSLGTFGTGYLLPTR